MLSIPRTRRSHHRSLRFSQCTFSQRGNPDSLSMGVHRRHYYSALRMVLTGSVVVEVMQSSGVPVASSDATEAVPREQSTRFIAAT